MIEAIIIIFALGFSLYVTIKVTQSFFPNDEAKTDMTFGSGSEDDSPEPPSSKDDRIL